MIEVHWARKISHIDTNIEIKEVNNNENVFFNAMSTRKSYQPL